MASTPARTRFAPSPTGGMHLGNLRTALFNALLAWREGGRFLLRIEDTDRARSEAGQAGALMADLQWLGLNWDDGPERDQPAGGAWQSGRGDVYAGHFERLEASGHAYPCFCSEAELARVRAAQRAAGQPPRYPGTCAALTAQEVSRRRAAGEPATLRFRIGGAGERRIPDLVGGEHAFRPEAIGDFVIRRADGSAAFFFSNAVDDALMGVTHVLRGEDHLANTPRQVLLLEALGLPVPVYGHIGLIVGEDGAPLSKRHGARTVAALREAGYLPAAVVNYLARLGHHYDSNALMALPALAEGFDPARLTRAPARFDGAQLDHWQAEAVAAAPVATLLDWLGAPGPVPAARREAFCEALRPNVRFPRELRDWAARLFDEPEWDEPGRVVLEAAGPAFFAAAVDAYERTGSDWAAFAAAVREATGQRGRELFLPLRVALTTAASGPELARVLELLPPAAVRARLQAAVRIAGSD